MKIKVFHLMLVLAVFLSQEMIGQRYKSFEGLVMAGYQGWFNTPDDNAGRGWRHYSGGLEFKPGNCTVEMWPDVSEYQVIYKTGFKFKEKSNAYTFSSFDPSTVETHFRWMQDYGIDGVFMQRFVNEIKNVKGKKHFDTVFQSAMKASEKYKRAICLMYDLSGMSKGDECLVLSDIDLLEDQYKMKSQTGDSQHYLYHNGKPLVAVWGAGFNDGRKYNLNEVEKIVKGLKLKGYSVLIGVPTYWRELNNDALDSPQLHEIIKACDIIMPWYVGRFDENGFDLFQKVVVEDIKWCSLHNVDFVPVCFPGFSWKNMNGLDSFYVDRNSGSFFWKQIYNYIKNGAKMLYVAMFDEIDEGTAIFPCLNKSKVPLNGEVGFVGVEDHLPTDFYLWLTGEAGRMLRGENGFTEKVPSSDK